MFLQLVVIQLCAIIATAMLPPAATVPARIDLNICDFYVQIFTQFKKNVNTKIF